MYRAININRKDLEDNIVLMKNGREPYATIPNSCVTNIDFSFQDVHAMDIIVSKKDNPELYDKFIGKRQQIIYNDEERFVIESCTETANDSGSEQKEIKAYSFDYGIDYRDEGFMEEGSYCLFNDYKDRNNDKKGILNMFFEDNPCWGVGAITEAALKEICSKAEQKIEKIAMNLTTQEAKKNSILWEKTFDDVRPYDDKSVMTIKFTYKNINIYNNTIGELQKTEPELIHEDFINIPSPIYKIKAEYVESDDYKNAIRYTIELSDGTKIIDYKNFLNVEGFKVVIQDVEMTYTTGLVKEMFDYKNRSFDEETFQWRSFLKDTVQLAFDVIFEFNNMSKLINCYATDEVGKHIGIKLSYENFIKEINKTNEYEKVISKLVVNSEKTSLHEANPLCTNYILDYSYFIDNKIMSKDCELAWYRYTNFVSDNQSTLNQSKSELKDLDKELIVLSSKKKAYELEIKNLEVLRNTYMKLDDTINVNRIAQEIQDKQLTLDAVNNKYEQVSELVEDLTEKIDRLIQRIQIKNATDSKGKIFNDDLIEEIEDLTIVDTIDDEFYDTSQDLYEAYKYLLHERNKLEISFETTMKNLLQNFIPPVDGEWRDKFKVGNFVDIDDRDINIASDGRIRIVGYSYSPKDKKVENISFSNKDKKLDDLVRLLEVGNDIRKTKGYADRYKNTWKESRIVNQQVSKMIDEGIDVQKQKINGLVGRSLLRIEDAAIYVVDAEDSNKQMYMGASMVASTDDNWKTYKKTIDEEGVNSGILEGDKVLNDKFSIVSQDKDFVIGITNTKDGAGLRVQDLSTGNIRVFLGTEKDGSTRKARFKIADSKGNEILNENGIISVNSFTTSDMVGRNCAFKTMFITQNEDILSSKLTLILSDLTSEVNTTNTAGAINKTFAISGTNVDVIVPAHSHEISYSPKIITGSKPTAVTIKINGQTVQQNINADISIDITSYVIRNGINNIEITSNTSGKITANIYNKTFVTY